MNNNPLKEIIINKAIKLHLQGNIPEAIKQYKHCIAKGFNDARIFSNYGAILQELGKLEEAAKWYSKAINLKPDFADAHSNLGNIFRHLGKFKEAELSTRKAIDLKPDFANAYSNLGIILYNLGKFKEAELSFRKAIELNPDHIKAHYNQGNLFSDLGKLKEAKISYRVAIQLNPNYAKAYYGLSLLKYSDENNIWKKQLFSKSILNHLSKEDQINVYFARANILHEEKNYEHSSKFLKLANQLKLSLNPSNSDFLINNSKRLLNKSIIQEMNKKEYTESTQSIFIVGMPRSGSTLLESILSMNICVDDLGESEILEESFKEVNRISSLAERYWKKIKDYKKKPYKTTNKNLYNYLFTGIIANGIPNAKIIHCYRNPLDNILSIYRANFKEGNQYSSSLVDSARVYLNQENIMSEYKKRFRSTIYDLNYDSLVVNPKKEIRSLINWLGWEWQESFLSPHLNSRPIKTRSNIEVRSPINSNSVGGWKNYKEMLKPAMEIITKKDKYKDLKY